MKVAMVGQKGIPTTQGGVERNVEHLSVELVKDGIEVIVYTRPHYTPRSMKKFNGVRLISLPSIVSKHLDAITHTFLGALHAIFIEKADVIHFHGIGPSLLSFLPRIFSPRTRVISTFHSLDMEHGKWGAFARFCLTLGARFACLFPHKTIAVSMKIREYCKERFHCDTVYIPYAVEIGNIYKTSQEEGRVLLEQFGLQPKKYIIAVTRLVRHKGVHHVLEAFQRAKDQFPVELQEYKLVIVGDSAFTDSYTTLLKNLVRNDDSVKLVGQQTGETLSVLCEHACLYVSGSESEGLSLASLEAMGYGLPILVSDIPENLELFLPEKRDIPGYLFQNRNVKDLTNKLTEILFQLPQAYGRGKVAKEIVEKYHSIPENARKVSQVYRQLVPIG